MKMGKTFWIPLLLALLSIGRVWSFPIAPVTLRELIEKSDLIVVADVVQQSDWRKAGDRAASPAQLYIHKVLKGKIAGRAVSVHFEPDVACPADAEFKIGGRVIAFLVPQEDTRGFRTVGLSYGAKNVSKADADVYVARIGEFLKIGSSDSKAATDWLIRCIEHPATRWEGAYELLRDDSRKEKGQFTKWLTKAHRQRLLKVLAEGQSAEADWRLADFMKDKAPKEVANALLKRLKNPKATVSRNHPDLEAEFPNTDLRYVARIFAAVLDDPTPRAVLKELEDCNVIDAEERQAVIKKALPLVEAAGTKRGYW